jgi:hypothetical protein
VERDAAEAAHVFGAEAFAEGARAFAEAHVQSPVQLILDAPMRSHRAGRAIGAVRELRELLCA